MSKRGTLSPFTPRPCKGHPHINTHTTMQPIGGRELSPRSPLISSRYTSNTGPSANQTGSDVGASMTKGYPPQTYTRYIQRVRAGSAIPPEKVFDISSPRRFVQARP